MRRLRVYRHSLSEGQFISQAGIELIEAIALDLKENKQLKASKVFYSSYTKSLQTATYLMASLEQPEIIAYQIPELSGKKSDEIFFKNHAFMDEYHSNAKEDLIMIIPKHLSGSQIVDIEFEAAKAIKLCFKHLSPWQTGIVIGHTPYISMAANHLSLHDTEIRVEGKKLANGQFSGLKEMEHIDFMTD